MFCYKKSSDILLQQKEGNLRQSEIWMCDSHGCQCECVVAGIQLADVPEDWQSVQIKPDSMCKLMRFVGIGTYHELDVQSNDNVSKAQGVLHQVCLRRESSFKWRQTVYHGGLILFAFLRI